MEEVLSIINNLENKKSYGYDDISNIRLKPLKEEVCTPLIVIINQYLLNGIFTDALKIAIVKPLLKKGEKNCFNNYRPIPHLPTISIILNVQFISSYTITLIQTIYWQYNSMVLGLNILQSWKQ